MLKKSGSYVCLVERLEGRESLSVMSCVNATNAVMLMKCGLVIDRSLSYDKVSQVSLH